MNDSSTVFSLRRLPRRRSDQSPSALAPAIEIVRDLEKLPSCFLAQLLDTPLQAPSFSASRTHLDLRLASDGWLVLYSTPEIARNNRAEVAGATLQTVFVGDILAALPLPQGCAGLVIDPRSPHEFKIPAAHLGQVQEIQAAVAVLSGDQLESESQDIPSGTEMTIATPLPEPPAEFVSLLTRELAARRDLKAAYLFDLIQENDDNRLTIGLVPKSSNSADLLAFSDRLLETLSSHLPELNELDLLILEEPELIEIVASTVPSLLGKKTA